LKENSDRDRGRPSQLSQWYGDWTARDWSTVEEAQQQNAVGLLYTSMLIDRTRPIRSQLYRL